MVNLKPLPVPSTFLNYDRGGVHLSVGACGGQKKVSDALERE